MTAINLPFAASATRRAPSTDELANGYGCGDADKELFDWLAWWQTGQIANVVSKSGLTVDDADLNRAAKAIRSLGLNYRAAGGSANALTVSLDPVPTDWAELINVPLWIKAASANTSGTVTLAPNGLATKPVKRLGGSALNAGDLQPNFFYQMIYDGTQMQIVSTIAPPAGISTTAAPRLIGFTAGNSGQSVPTSANTQITGLSVSQNNLFGTSTFSSNQLTVGAGEGGVWQLGGFSHFSAGSALGFVSMSIRVNGTQRVISGEGTTLVTAYADLSRPIVLAAGDVVTWFCSHQAGGTIGTLQHTVDAYLVSAIP
jgi:hypothetical protein